MSTPPSRPSPKVNWRRTLFSFLCFGLSLGYWLDRERSVSSLVQEEYERHLQWRGGNQFREVYTSSRFWDLERGGRVHPLLLEYADDLSACETTDALRIQYTVVINADGERERLDVEANEQEACLREVFTTLPFQSLAPLTGKLVLLGQVNGAALTPYTDPGFRSRTIQPGTDALYYSFHEMNLYRNGAPADERAIFTDVSKATLDELLGCDTTHEVIWLNASFEDSGPSTVSTMPTAPCIEEAIRTHWQELPALLYGQPQPPKTLHIELNLLTSVVP